MTSSRTPAAATGKLDETKVYYYWLLVALFLEYARPASFIPFLRIPFVYSLVPLTLFAISLGGKGKGFRPMAEIVKDPLTKWMLAYVVLVTFSFTYAIVGEFAFNNFKLASGFCILGILIARIATSEARLSGVIGTLMAAHVFLLAMNPDVVLNPESRSYIVGATFLGDGNDFGLSLCLLLPCATELAFRAKTKGRRLLVWSGVGIILMAVIGTQSRGATLGVAASLIYLWMSMPRKILSLVIASVLAFGFFVYAPPAYFTRMATIADYENEGSAMSRIDIWKAGTRMALDNPVLGVGAGNFPVAYGTKYKAPEDYAWKNAHSVYFQVWGELGTLGLVILVVLILGNLVRNGRSRAASRARLTRLGKVHAQVVGEEALHCVSNIRRLGFLNASIVGYAVSAAFLSAAYYPHLFIICGLSIAARAIAAQEAGLGVVSSSALRPFSASRGAAGSAESASASGAEISPTAGRARAVLLRRPYR